MAVPKKRTSKTKTRIRKTVWKKKANKQANKVFSKIKSFLSKENIAKKAKKVKKASGFNSSKIKKEL